MTDKEKLTKVVKLANDMYHAAQYLTTDASRLHKAMEEYHQFIIHEFFKKEPISNDFEQALEAEWKGYVDRGAATVDALEDNTQELAFAKGFYRGVQWQKEKDPIPAKDLEEVISYLSKRYPEVSFAKLSRIAVYVANWQKEQMMKNAIDAVVKFEYTNNGKTYGFVDYDFFALEDMGFEAENKVKLILIKED